MSDTISLRPRAVAPFDTSDAIRVLTDARWAIEQAAAGHAKDINWPPIRDALNELWPHVHDMTAAYSIYCEKQKAVP